MKPKHQRLLYILVTLAVLAAALTLVLRALSNEITYFYTPSDIAALNPAEKDRTMRLGGLVLEGSLKEENPGHAFILSDGVATTQIHFSGMLPALFREGQGIVAEGRLKDDAFIATTVLAKHDENYMPPEVARKLKETGHWKTGYGKNSSPDAR